MSNFMYEKREGGVGIKAWTNGVPVEHQAREQLHNTAQLPFVYKHLAVMPDVHLGKGATVGSVIPTKGAIIPAAVGVDIGCGMVAAKTNITANQLPDNLKDMRMSIEDAVPLGAGKQHNNAMISANDSLSHSFNSILEKHPELSKRIKKERFAQQLGTLGGGNHFIEVCLDEEDAVWIMLHSGSRGCGNVIGNYFIQLAKQDMERHFISLPDKDLAYLVEGNENYDDYVHAVSVMQDYAARNRSIMFDLTFSAVQSYLPEMEIVDTAINCHHNYVEKENHFGENIWITRKGAVRAREGDLGIIPGSMGTGSFIVRGLGNPDSFCSCSHGAGRIMSRGKAKELISLEDHEKAMEGIEARKDSGVLDESPAAYKDINSVMEAQSDLVEILHRLKQVVNVKG